VTTPAVAERAPRLPLHRQLAPRCAAGAARLLVRLPPARLARVLRVLSRGARPAGYAATARARQSVVAVSVRCAGLGCLQRSVATALLCRAHGRWADWCTGFRVQPFGAHAWVEVDGRPVDEPGELTAFRTVLAVRAPGSAPRGAGPGPDSVAPHPHSQPHPHPQPQPDPRRAGPGPDRLARDLHDPEGSRP
jgi:hypothetical protein